jgi:two-component system, NtrC family, sensor kinase
MMLKNFRDVNWRMRVFDSLSFPTLILNPDRTIVSVNRKFLEKIGAKEEELVGRTCREVFYQYSYDQELPCAQATCPLDKTLKEGNGHSILRQVANKGGQDRWEERVFSPILGEKGDVIYVIESVRDVTRTKTLEKMYYGVREFLDRVIQSSASAIMAADRDGRILLMNQAAEELFGCSFDHAELLNSRDLYPLGVARELMERLRDDRYGGPGKLPVTQVNIRTLQGEEVPVEMTGAIVYEGDREAGTMGIYNDLRERRAVERKLQEAEAQVAQSEKMASLGRLAAGVAHEINNPLTGILMYSKILWEKLGEHEVFGPHLEYILEDAERCRDIVKNLLAYSRQSSTSREFLSLNVLVEESLRLIRDQKLFMDVIVEKQLSEEPLPVFIDRNQMRQVVINLVINAIDAMDKVGTLVLETYKDNKEKRACLLVRDTGCGIHEVDRTRIFDPFFTTKEPGKGTGLGLSTSYGIVKDNEGDIRIKETGAEGTTLLLELPLAEKALTGIPESIG